MRKTILTIVILALLSVSANAAEMFVKVVPEKIGDVELALQESFEQNKLKQVAEIDVFGKMVKAGLPKKMGKNWNLSELSGLKSIIVCNGKLGMNIANINPMYAGVCPIKITMMEHKLGTAITYMRTAGDTKDPKLEAALKALDDAVIKAITTADYE